MTAFFATGSGFGREDKTGAAKEEAVVAFDGKTGGALRVECVREKTADWFSVTKDGKPAIPGKPRLGSTVELPPGTYVVRVNKSERKVTIEAGKKTILRTGDLVVEAKEGTPGWYTPYQGTEAKLADAPPKLNAHIALFAGKYTVMYRESGIKPQEKLGEADVQAGRTTVVKK